MKLAALLVAGGAGLRAGGDTPKQWRLLAGRPVLRWAAEGLASAGAELVVVVPAGEEARTRELLAGLPVAAVTAGGATRTLSVAAGLKALEGRPRPELVLIHDAARPFVSARHIQPLLDALGSADGALPALPLSDTLKRADANGQVAGTPSREGLHRAQTPQAFRYEALLAAYAQPTEATDDAALVEAAGGTVVLTPGDPLLFKLTFLEDFAMAEALAGAARVTLVGQGFDAHRFGPGDRVWLCGVEIAHDRALIGHSDADAGLHALTDALLGAIGAGDIGDHFPPSDPQWKGAASDRFLLHALELVRGRGGRVVNVDVTLICERPKVKPYREAMRERLAELLGLPLERVSVKATTMERMGFTGREEGLAASAIVSVEAPA